MRESEEDEGERGIKKDQERRGKKGGKGVHCKNERMRGKEEGGMVEGEVERLQVRKRDEGVD